MPDHRTKRQKLEEMAARGTEHEAAVARSKLDAMAPDIPKKRKSPAGQTPPPSPEDMETVFRSASPFSEGAGEGDLYFNGVKVGKVRGFEFTVNVRMDSPFLVDDEADRG